MTIVSATITDDIFAAFLKCQYKGERTAEHRVCGGQPRWPASSLRDPTTALGGFFRRLNDIPVAFADPAGYGRDSVF